MQKILTHNEVPDVPPQDAEHPVVAVLPHEAHEVLAHAEVELVFCCLENLESLTELYNKMDFHRLQENHIKEVLTTERGKHLIKREQLLNPAAIDVSHLIIRK